MATVSFIIKKTEQDPANLYVRFRHGRKLEGWAKTGFFVKRKDWDYKKQKLNQNGDKFGDYGKVNNELRKLETHIHVRFNEAYPIGLKTDTKWLKEVVDDFFGRNQDEKDEKAEFFTPFVEFFIQISPNRVRKKTEKPISPRTILDYKGTLKKLKHFEEVQGKRYTHLDINLVFHDEFVQYCRKYHGIALKTIGGEISNIKLFLKQAEIRGFKVCQDYKDSENFFAPDNDTHDIALNEDELERICNHDFSDNPKLANARDWFVIGLWTGLRVGDLLNLTNRDIKDEFFQLKNRKTGIYVVIGIHEEVQKIFDKQDGKFPRKISAQRFNEYIKEICRRVGMNQPTEGAKRVAIKVKGYGKKPKIEYRKQKGVYPKYELVSSHICRRTFATYHYGKMDTLSIMKITGHKTERQFLDYVKIPPKAHAIKLMELWRKLNAKSA